MFIQLNIIRTNGLVASFFMTVLMEESVLQYFLTLNTNYIPRIILNGSSTLIYLLLTHFEVSSTNAVKSSSV